MRVNSTFTGFLKNRFVVKSRIAIVIFVIFFSASSFIEHPGGDIRAKQVNLVIRQIGDRLLLQAGDSTSRVMPVTEMKEGTFLLRFEHEFVFSHDSLMALSQRSLPKTQFPSGYTVTVHDCTKGDIVYGFQLNNTSPDILACSGRSQPKGCYTIEFVFPDIYANVEEKKAGIGYLAESAKVDPRDLHSKREKLKTRTFGYSSDEQTKELNSLKFETPYVNPKRRESKTTGFNYPLIIVVCGGMLMLFAITLLIARFGKILKPSSLQSQDQATTTESVPGSDALGKFLFNAKGQRLLLGNQVISLTDKECRVLELLAQKFR